MCKVEEEEGEMRDEKVWGAIDSTAVRVERGWYRALSGWLAGVQVLLF